MTDRSSVFGAVFCYETRLCPCSLPYPYPCLACACLCRAVCVFRQVNGRYSPRAAVAPLELPGLVPEPEEKTWEEEHRAGGVGMQRPGDKVLVQGVHQEDRRGNGESKTDGKGL